MRDLIICECIEFLLYLTTLIWLLIRSKSSFISRRSPVILCISLTANFAQSMVCLTEIFLFENDFPEQKTDKCFILYRIRQALILLFHHLVFWSYILRAYRMYLIFNIDKSFGTRQENPRKIMRRITEKWLLRVLLIVTIPVAIVAGVAMAFCHISQYLPSSETKIDNTEYSRAEFILLSFLEELLFIFSIYLIRNVNDDYRMTKELTIAGILWFSVPIFSVFPFELTRYYFLPTVARNGILWYLSFINPLAASHYVKEENDIITLEMIKSIELILVNPITLEYFEKYLIGTESINESSNFYNSGHELLRLYMHCESYKNNPETTDYHKLTSQIINSSCFPYYYTCDSKDTFTQYVSTVQSLVLQKLKSKYFPGFLKSQYYQILQNYVYIREIYIGRIIELGI